MFKSYMKKYYKEHSNLGDYPSRYFNFNLLVWHYNRTNISEIISEIEV